MDAPRYEYDPRDVYQWANGDRDEALSREDGFLGSTMTTSGPRSETRAQSSRFNEHVVLTSRPFAVGANGPTPDDLAHQTDQRNFTTNTNLNVYDQYSRFGSPSLSLVIPQSNDIEVYGRFVPAPQPPSNGGEYKGPGSYPRGDYTQYRGYLASSRGTAQQQQQLPRPTGTGTGGPIRIRHDVWRVKARPYQQRVEAAELARRNSSLALSAEDRRTALRTQFHAQRSTTSPISPSSSSPLLQLTSSKVPYLGDNRQPFPTTRSAPNSLDASDSVLHHVPPQSPSTFDESLYPPTFSGGWRDPNLEHTSFSQSSGAGSSSSSSEHISLSQMNLGAPVPINSTAPATSTSVGTMFIHSNLTQPSSNPRNNMQDYPEYQHFFPLQTEAHRQLRVTMHHILNSDWKLRNELEPTSQDILQFSTRVVIDGTTDGEDSGAFKYRCLLYHGGEMCSKSWARAERMLAHLRGAIDLRPFACEGAGGGCNCGMRFFAEDTLQQHRKNTRAIGCQYCGAGVTPRNIKRHLRNNCPKSPQRAHDQDPPA